MEKQVDFKETIILYTYRYIWKNKDGKLCVRYLTEPQEGHAKFQEAIRNNEDIISCMREYIHEINFEYLGFTEPVKTEVKENVQEADEKSV